MTVGELLSKTSSYELAEWMAYEMLEPFGEKRADVRSAMICQTLANIHRDSKKTPSFQIKDFLIEYDKPYKSKQEEENKKLLDSKIKDLGNKLKFSGGLVKVYEGDAPPIRRIGKRGKPAKSGKRKF